MKRPVSIDTARLQREIDDLALISESPPPVVTRVLFSDADLQARAVVKKLCVECGLKLREDAVGNIFARWEGKETESACRGHRVAHRRDSERGQVRRRGRRVGSHRSDSRAPTKRLPTATLDRAHRLHFRGTDAFRYRMSRQPTARRRALARTCGGVARSRWQGPGLLACARRLRRRVELGEVAEKLLRRIRRAAHRARATARSGEHRHRCRGENRRTQRAPHPTHGRRWSRRRDADAGTARRVAGGRRDRPRGGTGRDHERQSRHSRHHGCVPHRTRRRKQRAVPRLAGDRCARHPGADARCGFAADRVFRPRDLRAPQDRAHDGAPQRRSAGDL